MPGRMACVPMPPTARGGGQGIPPVSRAARWPWRLRRGSGARTKNTARAQPPSRSSPKPSVGVFVPSAAGSGHSARADGRGGGQILWRPPPGPQPRKGGLSRGAQRRAEPSVHLDGQLGLGLALAAALERGGPCAPLRRGRGGHVPQLRRVHRRGGAEPHVQVSSDPIRGPRLRLGGAHQHVRGLQARGGHARGEERPEPPGTPPGGGPVRGAQPRPAGLGGLPARRGVGARHRRRELGGLLGLPVLLLQPAPEAVRTQAAQDDHQARVRGQARAHRLGAHEQRGAEGHARQRHAQRGDQRVERRGAVLDDEHGEDVEQQVERYVARHGDPGVGATVARPLGNAAALVHDLVLEEEQTPRALHAQVQHLLKRHLLRPEEAQGIYRHREEIGHDLEHRHPHLEHVDVEVALVVCEGNLLEDIREGARHNRHEEDHVEDGDVGVGLATLPAVPQLRHGYACYDNARAD
mmetsp:Transcript_60679/g.162182  ORF Transcript_60679/g.162182 Transcript_60679/m.162182 type:complete len:466 (+) Transcript_60679:117-1514(+)